MHGESSLDFFGVAWRLGATVFFVVLNGFFVAAEFALVKARPARIDELVRQGNRTARGVRHILSHLDRYLSACQLGITLASLALGALGEPAVSRLLLAGAAAAGIEVGGESAWISIVSITIAFSIITILHMTLGEQAPKMWAIRRAESTSLMAGPTLRAFTFLFHPFITLINNISNWMLRVAGLPQGGHGGEVPSVDEIRGILSLSARAGQISDKEFEITQNVFRLIELEARHIMVPRVEVDYLSLARGPDENLSAIRRSSHSRLPLCETDLDTLLGFVHGKDVLEMLLAGGTIDLRTIVREAVYVPDTMPLSDLLLEMQAQRAHVVAVIDEHGTLTGLAFREDALEEIVGKLGDEFDNEPPQLQEIKENVYEIRGSTPFPDVCSRLGIETFDEGEETIGGLLVAKLGRLPREGDRVEIQGWDVTVLEVARRRVLRSRFRKRELDEGATAAPEN